LTSTSSNTCTAPTSIALRAAADSGRSRGTRGGGDGERGGFCGATDAASWSSHVSCPVTEVLRVSSQDVAAQVAFESKGLMKLSFHFILLALKVRNQAVASYGSSLDLTCTAPHHDGSGSHAAACAPLATADASNPSSHARAPGGIFVILLFWLFVFLTSTPTPLFTPDAPHPPVIPCPP
jgi:hypothetical protein